MQVEDHFAKFAFSGVQKGQNFAVFSELEITGWLQNGGLQAS